MTVGARLPMLETSECFAETLASEQLWPLRRERVTTLQVNVGKLCNMACHHCHVEAGPKRTEIMSARVVDRVIELVQTCPTVEVVDITGGAPELNPDFRRLVASVSDLGRGVIDRSNLTVLLEPGQEDLAEFLRCFRVHVVASLPCYQKDNVDRQRGKGAFERSLVALRRLNRLGYGRGGSGLKLDLVYNPTGPFLPPDQATLQQQYKRELQERFGITFDELLTITNMPIKRFADSLRRDGMHEKYVALLRQNFNPNTVSALMCRALVSVGWDGRLYDCDFNQMLEIDASDRPRSIWDIEDLTELCGVEIATRVHCFGCTAGAGSSCGGALSERETH